MGVTYLWDTNIVIYFLDAIIAATAIANNLTLITRNTKDFEAITGLVLLNPFEL